ncbi:hypothetical protein H6P81_015957 [Aristolochia fimbriata]|uniref:Uncharacterized protein n=1 Tax=Aristolochia fimbriata TaxID=158543 RepID=A0AAV7EA46_ARIFI|nr:hypothetical protein H6P81_015957 [Aristolochia fimbriata]
MWPFQDLADPCRKRGSGVCACTYTRYDMSILRVASRRGGRDKPRLVAPLRALERHVAPLRAEEGLVAPARFSAIACPSTPLLSAQGKGPCGPSDPFAQLEFFRSFTLSGDRSVPPLPILTCTCGRLYGALLASPCTGGASASGQRRASGACWTCAGGASGHMSRRVVVRSSLHCTDLPRPCWVAGIPWCLCVLPRKGQLALMYSPFETRPSGPVSCAGGRAQSASAFTFPSA